MRNLVNLIIETKEQSSKAGTRVCNRDSSAIILIYGWFLKDYKKSEFLQRVTGVCDEVLWLDLESDGLWWVTKEQMFLRISLRFLIFRTTSSLTFRPWANLKKIDS